MSPSSSGRVLANAALQHKAKVIASAAILIVLVLGAAYGIYSVFLNRSGTEGPGSVAKISNWNRPMDSAVLSPDGRTIAFISPTEGFSHYL